ncbi:glycosyltransferase family 2 protein [Candidatus Falkowbacteria bacterium]|jgi:GT2 family glycosyltransferase|nr:glycosyltransferase family 2 protein [Candidatus Falkowbacteria bacterium]
MNLSVVIVSWQVKEKLRENLCALFNSQGDFKLEVLVVDNNSNDGTVEMLRNEFPAVKLIANSENRGFAAANNQALKLAQGEYLLLLNPDMLVRTNTLAEVLSWAKNNPQATVIGCKLENEQGEIVKQVRRFPDFFDQLAVTLKWPHLFPGIINKYLCSDFDYSQPAKVDSIRGAFFLINRENYKKISGQEIPLLDERYFIWFEEVDFCREVYKLGGEVWYTPVGACLDYVGQSFKQVKRGQAQKYFSDSMLKYFQKWEATWKFKILKFIWKIILLIL